MEAASGQGAARDQGTGSAQIEVGKVLGEIFSTYRSNWRVLLATALGVFMIAGALNGVLRGSGSLLLLLLGVVIQLAAEALYTGFIVKLVQRVRANRRQHSVADLVSSASGAIGRLIWNGILKGIAVAIGLVLLIAPGLFLLTIWAVAAPAIVAERRGAIEAFGRSRELVRGQGWSVFAVIAIVFVIGLVVGAIAAAIGAAIGDTGQVFFGALASIIVAPISALAASILFFDLGGSATPPPPPAEPPPAEGEPLAPPSAPAGEPPPSAPPQ